MDWIAEVSGWLETASTHASFYGVIYLMAVLDAFFPVVPSETAVILGGIAAGQDALALPLVIAAGAVGALTGDSISYAIGRRSGSWLERRVFHTPSRQARLQWATEQLRRRGALLLLTARFIPGGRTAVTLSSGLTRQPYRRFLCIDAIACGLWASYAGILGFVFGERFKDDHTKAFLLAFGAAISVSLSIEAVRWVRHRRARRAAITSR